MKRNSCICVLMAALLLTMLAMSGCAGDKLAAKVGDAEITASYLENMYNSNASYASYYGYDVTTAEGVDSFVQLLLDESIASEAKVYQAKLAGISLTDEEQAKAKEDGGKAYDDLFQQYVDAAEQNGAADPKAQALTYLTDSLASSHTTLKKLKSDLVEDAEDEILVEKHRQALLLEAVLTEEEIRAMYDEELEVQRAAFESDPSAYFTYETYNAYGYTAMPLTVPEGFFFVRQILVEDEEKANELYDEIQAGDDFETLLAEFNTDPGMEQEAYREGYLIGKGANYVESFLTAALELEKEGDVSKPVKSEHGWHIIKRMADKAPGDIPYAEIQEAFTAYAKTKHETEYYQSLVDEWTKGDYIVRYPENYSEIGKAALVG